MSRALITGCSTGIGRALAQGLSAAGHEVIATARSVATLEGLDVHRRLALDVTSDESVEALRHDVGDIDILVNNAGISVWGPVETTDPALVQRILETNVLGAVRMIQAFVPPMRRRGAGAVLNISSIAALRPGSRMLGWYGASKAALEVISEALRDEVSGAGVRVVLVVPGLIESDLGVNRVIGGADGPPYRAMAEAFVADATLRRRVEHPAELVVRCVLEVLAHPDPPLRWAASPDAVALVDARTTAPGGLNAGSSGSDRSAVG